MNPSNNPKWQSSSLISTNNFGAIVPQPGGLKNFPSAAAQIIMQENNAGQQWYQQSTNGQQKLGKNSTEAQDWLTAQQNSAETQRLSYERMVKQKKFNEQKERLKEFGSRKKKDIVTADAMIQNIFDKQGPKSKVQKDSDVSRVSTVAYQARPISAHSNQQFRLNAVSQNYILPLDSTQNTHSLPPTISNHPPLITQLPQEYTNSSLSYNIMQNKPKNIKHPLPLPTWLTHSTKTPELYKKAIELVNPSGDWVDTGLASGLLMLSGVPSSILGCVWESVNRSSNTAELSVSEFMAALALVAYVQSGKPFINADEALLTLDNPVYPLLDHPVLFSLHPSHKPEEAANTFATNFPGKAINNPVITHLNPVDSNQVVSEDDFDDFVSAEPPIPSNPLHENQNESLNKQSTEPALPVPDVSFSDGLNRSLKNLTTIFHQPTVPDLVPDPTRSFKNLPTLGLSPEHKKEEDFDDFQSALPVESNLDKKFDLKTDQDESKIEKLENPSNLPDISQSSINTGLTNPVPSASSLMSLESGVDKYDVFRNLSSVDTTTVDVGNEEFGDFRSAEEGATRSKTADSSESSYLTANVSSADTSHESDDFGSWVAHDVISTDTSVTSAVTSTVTSTAKSIITSTVKSVVSSTDLFVTPVFLDEDKSTSLSMESSIDKTMDDLNSLDLTSSVEICNDVAEVKTSDLSIANIDKYSVIRGQTENNDNISIWTRILEGGLKLLQEGLSRISQLAERSLDSAQKLSLLAEVMKTSQMVDYLTNLLNVYRVCCRVCLALEGVGASAPICDVGGIGEPPKIWGAIMDIVTPYTEDKILLCNLTEEDGNNTNSSTLCGVCGGVDSGGLTYGGETYHPQCANLWLNVVDWTLPRVAVALGGSSLI